MLTLHGLSNKVRGDGDSHMRGMSCLLTGIELFPGNIQGGSHTPAGWASGISIDQEIRGFLQSRAETRTRFGSLELGVGVPNRADPWTRSDDATPLPARAGGIAGVDEHRHSGPAPRPAVGP
jgi:hypothetical protein